MMTLAHIDALHTLSDRELIAETHRLAERECHATAHVIAALMEMDARKLYLGEGYSSLFTYCTHVLNFSEHAAYGRIEAARVARRFPAILDQLADGSLTLTTVGLLASHLTPDNHAELLAAARHKSKRDVEHFVAALRPLPAVPSSVRKLPAAPTVPPVDRSLSVDTSTAAPDLHGGSRPAKPAVLAPLTPERYKVQVTISREAHDKLRRAQDLLRHSIPNGDPAAIFERALTLLVEDLERKKLAAARRPRAPVTLTPKSRHVPAAVKREVWARDEGRCAFVGSSGRCTERGFLEFHHVVPFADGGPTDAANLRLYCRAHNAFEAEDRFGPLITRERAPAYPGGGTRSGPSRL
jgi:5-methylcytosine-specific restriction endonuclease McrA